MCSFENVMEGSNLNVPTVNRSGFSFCHFVLNVIPAGAAAAAGCSLKKQQQHIVKGEDKAFLWRTCKMVSEAPFHYSLAKLHECESYIFVFSRYTYIHIWEWVLVVVCLWLLLIFQLPTLVASICSNNMSSTSKNQRLEAVLQA